MKTAHANLSISESISPCAWYTYEKLAQSNIRFAEIVDFDFTYNLYIEQT